MSELGNILREAREERGVSLDELQTTTKIQKRYLLAIEKGDFGQLPGDFYTRAFVKTYAEALGLNAAELMDTYQSELPKRKQDIEQLPPRSERVQTKYNDTSTEALNFLPKLLIIILLLAVAVVIWYLAQSHGQNKDTGVQENTGSDVSMKEDPNAGSKLDPTTDQSTDGGDDTTDTTDTNKSKASEEQKNSDNLIQKIKIDKKQGGTSYLTLSGTDTFVLDIKALDDSSRSWVEVHEKNSNGKRLFYGMLTKDNEAHLDLSDQDVVFIKVGLTKSAIIKINGKDFDYPNNLTTQNLYFTFDKQASSE